MRKSKADLLQGTLDLLILKALTLGPLHGWGVSKRIRDLSRDVLEVNQGSQYPALHRLEDKGLLSSEWGISDEGRRARFYPHALSFAFSRGRSLRRAPPPYRARSGGSGATGLAA